MTSVFERAFGLRQPYQLIVDGDFLETTLKQKMMFRDLLPTVLGGPVKLFTTACVLQELRKNRSEAMFNAKRLEIRRCPHTGRHQPGVECIKSIIGEGNEHHYGVCAQSDQLREALRCVPGTPLVFVYKGVLVMEDPSEATLQEAERLQKGKMKPDLSELALINKLVPVLKEEKAKKRKKKGGPNPLSCKKKQLIGMPTKISSEQSEHKKPKRNRRHRPKKNK